MNQTGNVDTSLCVFCGGKKRLLYKMGEYDILKCSSCGTGSVNPFSASEVVSDKYDGFLGKIDINSLLPIKKAAGAMFKQLGLEKGQELKMLDIGGGGGFFSRAFEDMGYGQSTFVDIDPRSCEFASLQLKLASVVNCDALDIDKHIENKFDFIFSRHLIEHLSRPVEFLDKSLMLLKDGGTFLVQCPNGESLEYFAYLKPYLKKRLRIIRETNNYSTCRILWIMATGGMLHGIDPPRHLWAITGEAIRFWAKKRGVFCDINYYPLSDNVYSPHWNSRESLISKIQDIVASKVFASIKGGTHLVAVIRKNKNV